MGNASAIDALLPQTQCTRCGYTGCLPYAEAIANGEADINQCPPGGTETIVALAKLTGRAMAPLNRDNGVESAPTVAFIDEERCIGCTKCLPPCPVDAIVGAPRRSTLCTAGWSTIAHNHERYRRSHRCPAAADAMHSLWLHGLPALR